jgi:hypothetical protein
LLFGFVTRAEADDPPPAPLHIGDSGDGQPSSLRNLKSGFSQFGGAAKASKTLPASVETLPAPEPRSDLLDRAQGGFAVKQWDGKSKASAAAEVQTSPAAPLHGDRAVWHGAFRSAPVPMTDSGVVQTAGQVPLEPVKAAMLPMPASPNSTNEGNRPPLGSPNIEVPVTPPSSSIVTVDDSYQARLKEVNCKTARDLKSIRSITADIGIKPRDLKNPETGLALQLPPECTLEVERLEPRHWERTTFSWVAAATYHRPIYFDDDQLERYGHTFGPVTQTTLSAVKFFATVPLVPYYMGVYPPNECIYDLGLYRPGSCAPYDLDPFPLSVRGAINEGLFLGTIPAL